MNGHDYVAALAEEYRNATGLGHDEDAKNVLAEIERVADKVGENEWAPKAGLRDDFTVDAQAEPLPSEAPEPAPEEEKAS